MNSATIVPVQEDTSNDQRLVNFIKRQQKLAQSKKKDPKQLVLAEALKKQSLHARTAVDALIRLLKGFGAEVTIEHTKAALLSHKTGEPGYGRRNVFFNLWFNEEDSEPKFDSLNASFNGDECYVSAQAASGYSVAKVVLPLDEGQHQVASASGDVKDITIFGKSICSANEVFNGNIGAFFALMDALHLLSKKQDLGFPIGNLFFFAAALMPLRLESPSHYEENLKLALENRTTREIDDKGINLMAITLKADAGEKVRILTGEYAGKTGTVMCIHGYGTVSEFFKLYEPAYEIVTEDGRVQARFNSEDIERI
jgi:hypothetical protein